MSLVPQRRLVWGSGAQNRCLSRPRGTGGWGTLCTRPQRPTTAAVCADNGAAGRSWSPRPRPPTGSAVAGSRPAHEALLPARPRNRAPVPFPLRRLLSAALLSDHGSCGCLGGSPGLGEERAALRARRRAEDRPPPSPEQSEPTRASAAVRVTFQRHTYRFLGSFLRKLQDASLTRTGWRPGGSGRSLR